MKNNRARGLAAVTKLLSVIALSLASQPLQAAKQKMGSGPAELYHDYCSVCHGERGDGQSRARASLSPPPLDFTNSAMHAALTRERMMLAVREGRPGTAMVSWKNQLNDGQITQIVDYIRENFMRAAKITDVAKSIDAPKAATTSQLVLDRSALLPSQLKGNHDRGQRLYEQNCVACHGKAGDGNGPRAYFIMPRPRNFLAVDSRAAFSRPVLFQAIAFGKRGTEMPAWDKVLSKQEIADVAEYVFQRFITASNQTNMRIAK